MSNLEKKIAKRLVLTESNPTMAKVMKLWEITEELGLTLTFHGQTTIVEDKDRDPNLPMLRLEDIETLDGPQEWPPSCEFKLVYDNPEYLAEQKRAVDAGLVERAAKFKAAEDKRKAQEAEEQRLQAIETENRERKQLAKLKAKYPNG